MKKFWPIALALGLGFAGNAWAIKVAKVTIPDSAEVGGASLQLNGAGLRKVAFIKVYVGALYLDAKVDSSDAVYANTGAKRVSMRMMRGLSAGKMRDAWTEGFEKNHTAAEFESIKAKIEQFNGFFEDVEDGDEIFIDFVPGEGTSVTIKGNKKGSIAGDDFNTALLKIWLGDEPADDNLKEAMLGG